MLVRFIRLRDAFDYLGMDKNRFNSEVRPYLTEIPIGRQGIAFDRLEMDAWADQYMARNGRPAAKRRKPWDVEEHQDSSREVGSGTLRRELRGMDAYERARERVITARQRGL